MNTVISVEHLSKSYRLGQIGTGTFAHDLNAWWAKLRGQPNPMLRIGEQDHSYRDGEELWALKDVSFTVEQGEVLGIIGRNGAGKSTLLKILSRVTAPTSGRIKIKGRIASLLEVGTGFHPELTGRENIYLNGAILGMKREEIARKFDEIVNFAEVEKFIDTPVKRYSSGMYVRLAFAVAAHLDPEILVVDEVLAVGDAEFQKKCLGKMGEVAQGGRTVLFVSHNMAAISSLCNKCLLIKKGMLKDYGEAENIISKYMTGNAHQNTVYLNQDDITVNNIIRRVAVIDQEGTPIKSINMGQPFGIQAEFSSTLPLSNPGLGVRINTPLGFTVLGTTSYTQSKVILSAQITHGVFRVFFQSNPLNQGIYYITLVFAESQMENSRYENIISFEILPRDVFGTGHLMSSSQSAIFLPAKWEIINRVINWE